MTLPADATAAALVRAGRQAGRQAGRAVGRRVVFSVAYKTPRRRPPPPPRRGRAGGHTCCLASALRCAHDELSSCMIWQKERERERTTLEFKMSVVVAKSGADWGKKSFPFEQSS